MAENYGMPVAGTVVEIFRSKGIGPAVASDLDCTVGVVKYITQAKHSIVFGIYSLASEPIAQALIHAHRRGVSMRGIADNTQWAGRSSLCPQVIAAGIDLIRAKNQHACMHIKLLVIDQHIVGLGSFNWTNRAEGMNDECYVICDSPEAAVVFTAQIDQARSLNPQT